MGLEENSSVVAVADFEPDMLTEDSSPPPEPPAPATAPQGEAKPPEAPRAGEQLGSQPVEVVPAVPPAVVTPPAVPPTQPAKPEVAASPMAQPVPGATPPSTSTVPETPAQPSAPAPTPTITAEEIAARRTALVGEIEKKYGFTNEDQEKLLTEPHAVLPKMAANLYVDVYEGVLQTVMSQLPRLLDVHQRQFTAARDNEEAFYRAWPQLKRENQQHVAAVRQFATIFRQTYPQASREDFIKSVGAMAAVQLGLATSPSAAAPAPPPKAQPSFTPAGTGTVGNSPPVVEENNPFADMLEE